MTSTSQGVMEVLTRNGNSRYGGECVTQLEHALQTSLLAEQAGAPESLIVAALVHDIGHMLHDLPDDAPEHDIDDRHEIAGDAFLRARFPESVCQPVRLHVDAKRYLCAVEPEYQNKLSEPSVVSLNLQGGPMSPQEVVAFEANAFYREAVQLRRWDDEAKIADLETPTLSHFAAYIDRLEQEHHEGAEGL